MIKFLPHCSGFDKLIKVLRKGYDFSTSVHFFHQDFYSLVVGPSQRSFEIVMVFFEAF